MDDSIAATESAMQAKELGDNLLAELKQAVQGQAEHPAEPSRMSDEDYKELFRRVNEATSATQEEIDRIIAEFMAQHEALAAEQTKQNKLEKIRQEIAA